MAKLPAANDLIGNGVTEAQFKANLKVLIENVFGKDQGEELHQTVGALKKYVDLANKDQTELLNRTIAALKQSLESNLYSKQQGEELKRYIDSLVINANSPEISNLLENLLADLSAAGAGENGWITSLVQDVSGLNQEKINKLVGTRWYNTAFEKGEKVLMQNGTRVISRINNNTVDPSIDFSNWMTEGNYVTPDMFGAIADGREENATADTQALQKAVATGRFVKLTPGKNYRLNAEITPNNGSPLVIFGAKMGTGETGATISTVSGFTGYMLKPKSGYDIRDVRIIGSGVDGCFPLGNNIESSAGLARVERFYFSNCDLGIAFGDQWEHPWGLYYKDVVGLHCRTGGIDLGGNIGGIAASSGESAWTLDNILLIGSDTAGNSGSGGIEATSVSVTTNITSTTDKILWNNDQTPYYGWCVMRSSDGLTNWHVPPNWTSDLFKQGEFTASKNAGELWNYKVIRMTKGLNIRRAKAVNIGIAQCEYFGIGTQLSEVQCATLSQSYSESRERTVPLSNFCAIRLNGSSLTLGGGHCEKSSYGISVFNNSVLTLTGRFNARNCKLGKAQMGGSTQQQMYINKLHAADGTPDKIVGTDSIYDYAIQESKYYDDGVHEHIGGGNSSGYHVFRRGVQKAKIAVEASGLSVVESDIARIGVASKTLTPSFANESVSTVIPLALATKFLTLSNIAINAGGVAKFDVFLTVRDSSVVARQVLAGTLRVQYLRAANSNVTASVTAEKTILSQQGVLNAVEFTVSTGTDFVELFVTVDSSQSGGSALIQLVPVSIIGGFARSIVITAS